jgi:hypothetical protein
MANPNPTNAALLHRPPIRIHEFPSNPELDDDLSTPADPRIPDYFHSAKEYIFKALQDDAFVRFIRAKAFCNLTRLGTFIRLFAGLFCLWASFVVAFTLVFYDYKPKIRRLYVSLRCILSATSRSGLIRRFSTAHHSILFRILLPHLGMLRSRPAARLAQSLGNASLPDDQDGRAIRPKDPSRSCGVGHGRGHFVDRNHGDHLVLCAWA